MLALQAEEGEGSGNPSEPQPPPSTAQPTHEEPIPNIESSSPQKTQSPRQALNKDTELPQTSVPIPNVPDEVVHQERGDSVERAATAATSLEAMQDSNHGGASVQTRFERASKLSYDSKLKQRQERAGYEAAIILQEQLNEEEIQRIAKDAEDEWEDIRARVKADEELTQKLQAEERDKYSEVDQARMLVDLINQRKRYFTAQKAKAKRNKPMTQAQQRTYMSNYIKHMGSHTMQQLKRYTFDELKELFETTMKHVSTFTSIETEDKERESELAAGSSKRPRAEHDEEHDEESVKKQKLEENDAEKEELRACLDIVPGDEIAMDFESLATKYPIIDWKTHILTENMMYYQIIRADGSSKNYKIFSEMLDDFDRQDVVDLHRLVQERYETTSPEGYDLLLWGDLKTLFEPCEEDEVWRNQQGYNLISWRLFDSCGVHVLLMDNGIAIHMMIEKKYPLTQEMLSRMINRRLVDVLKVKWHLSFSDLQDHNLRSKRVFGYILLVIKMLIMNKLDD
ncbi:hypothetical protein Tco_0886904 [Tanacetum coccineum]